MKGAFLALLLFAWPAASAELPIIAETGEKSYDRALYRHWIDEDGDGLDTRQEVLIRESYIAPMVGDGGKVTSGLWMGPYTGFVTTKPGNLDIDHLVPLKEAHVSGGHAWSAKKREAYANDLGHPQALIATKAAANRSKGAKDPAGWMPPNRAYWCQYLTDWVIIKQRWGLAVDQAEADAITTGLEVCGQYKSRDQLGGQTAD